MSAAAFSDSVASGSFGPSSASFIFLLTPPPSAPSINAPPVPIVAMLISPFLVVGSMDLSPLLTPLSIFFPIFFTLPIASLRDFRHRLYGISNKPLVTEFAADHLTFLFQPFVHHPHLFGEVISLGETYRYASLHLEDAGQIVLQKFQHLPPLIVVVLAVFLQNLRVYIQRGAGRRAKPPHTGKLAGA